MPHWKKMMEPKEMIFAFDLDGKDVTLTIEKVIAGELTGDQGRKTKKPIIHFKETKKKLAANNTNCKIIAQIYGSHETNDWIGKRITLWPTTTNFGGNTVDCVRIRPHVPKEKNNGNKLREPEADEPSAAQIETDAVAAEKAAQTGAQS